MRARLSIIIPTLNSAKELPDTIGCLFEGLEAGLIRELIVSDGGSHDATKPLAEKSGARLIIGKSGRGGQLARGADMAGGDWLLFLHSDTWLEKGWSNIALQHIQHPDRAGYFRLRFRANGFGPWFVAGWANFRSRVFSLPYGDQGLLISRTLYDEIGGFEDIALMEDVALARRLRRRLIALPALASTNAQKYQRGGWFRRGARNLWTLARYFVGVAPEELARTYSA